MYKHLLIATDGSELSERSARHGIALAWEANSADCDLIVMDSHGRRGIAGFLIGNETVRTLTHSSIPLLVYRE